jgi:catechol 2,3-dioxygenase-like lactoylglutathione lyase family enzyme
MAVFPAAKLDHCSFVVPDLDAAVQFFQTYFGFQLLSERSGLELQGDHTTRVYAMPPSATGRSARLLAGASVIELRAWNAGGEAINPLRESSVPGCHIALAVPDLEAVIAELRNIPRMRFLEPAPDGSFVFCFTPYGFQLQLLRAAAVS